MGNEYLGFQPMRREYLPAVYNLEASVKDLSRATDSGKDGKHALVIDVTVTLSPGQGNPQVTQAEIRRQFF